MSILSESKYLIEKIIQKQFNLSNLNPSLPFCIYKMPTHGKQLSDTSSCIPMNRYTDARALLHSKSHISIWSQSHVNYLKSVKSKNDFQMNKILLKNPFKTEALIKESIAVGLKSMVIQSFEQLWKIHKCRSEQASLPSLNFVWNINEYEKDLVQLQTLKSYNIQITGLLLNSQLSLSPKKLKCFLKSLLLSQPIKRIYLQVQSEQFLSLRQQLSVDTFFKEQKIQIILENTEFKMTNGYFIAAKVIGKDRRGDNVVSDDVRHYLNGNKLKKAQVQEEMGRKYIFSQISHFPAINIMQEHQKKGVIRDML